MTWRGTFLLLLAGIVAAVLLLVTLRTRTRPADAPLLGIVPAETTGLEIAGGGSTTLLENRDGVWWITLPLTDRADPTMVSRLLGAAADAVPLDRLRPADLKGMPGLDALDLRPAKRAITVRGGKGSHTLRIGAEGAAPGRVYAQVDSDPSVYLISSETADIAFRPIQELRDPSPLPVRPERISGIVLQQQGGYRELALVRKGRDWTLESPLRAKADAKAVGEWIRAVLGSRILRWMPPETEAAACGLDVPEAVLTVSEKGGESARLELGKVFPGAPGSPGTPVARYARVPGRPGIFVLGDAGPWMSVTPAALRLRHPSPVELDSVDRILVSGGGRSFSLARKPQTEDWLCGERTIPGTDVTRWYACWQETKASSFETATPEHLASRGIDPLTPSSLSIRFVARLSENSAEEAAGEMTLAEWTIGAPSSDGTLALREGSADDLMILPTKSVQPLLEEVPGWIAPQQTASPSPTATATSSPAIP